MISPPLRHGAQGEPATGQAFPQETAGQRHLYCARCARGVELPTSSVRLRPLTDRQRTIFEFLCTHIETQGYPPTVREIADHFGLSSTNGVADHLFALESKGWISRNRRVSRGIRVMAPTHIDPSGG